MYLTIPGKDDFNLIQKIGSFDRRKIISSYSALNGFNKYSPYDICLRETGGTIESPRGTVYSTSLHEMKNSYDSEFNEVILTADAIEIETKGELVQETKTGEKIYNYGTCFLQNNELSDLSKYRYITSDSFTDTGKKYPISIDDNGEIVYGKILLNKETGKRIIVLKAVDNKIIDADPSLISPDAIERKDIIILEETPMRWLVDGEKAITIDTPFIAKAPENYVKSQLKTIINSPEFQEIFGLEPTQEKSKSKNPFKVGNQTLDQQVKKAIKIGIIPFLVGPPGVGKTEILESQSKHVLRYNMARFTPTSFTGKDYVIPGDTISYTDERGKTITHTEKALTGSSEPVWLQEVKQALEEAKEDGEDVILFLDEFDKLTPALQVFINGIIDENPTLGGWPVPEGVKIALAGNTTVDSLASNKISSEVSSRLMTILVKPNLDEWIRWAIKADIDPIVIAYLKIHPEDLLTTVYGADGRPDPTLSMNPRKWAKMVSKELKEARANESELMLKNYMSEEQVEKFMGFIDEYYDNYIDDILNETAPPYITADVGKNSFVVTILSVVTKIEQLRAVIKSIPENEFRRMFITTWVNYHPQHKTEAYEIIQEMQLEEESIKHGY